MKKILMIVCSGLMCFMLMACGEETVSETDDGEEYVEEEDTSEEATESEAETPQVEDLVAEFQEVYAGAYGDNYEIVLAFDWTEEEQNGLVMIIPNGSKEMEYFNVGTISGEIGSKQTISGLAEYPFTFTVSDYSEDGSQMELSFDDDGVCTVNLQNAAYLQNKCKDMGMY